METTEDVLTQEQAETLIAARRVLADLESASNERLAAVANLLNGSLASLLVTATVWADSDNARAVLGAKVY